MLNEVYKQNIVIIGLLEATLHLLGVSEKGINQLIEKITEEAEKIGEGDNE